MIKHPKRKNLMYYLKRLVVLVILCLTGYFAPIYWEKQDQLDVKKILDDSELKNKTFEAKVQKIENGVLSAYFMEEHSNPIISVSFLFKNAGSAHDAEGQHGLALLASSVLTDGAGEFDEKEFNEFMEENGVKIKFSVTPDDFKGWMAFPSQNKTTATNLLRAALTEPHADEKILEVYKNKIKNARLEQNEKPNLILQQKFNENIFAGHPYSRNYLGNDEDVANLTSEDILNYVKKSLAKDNLMVGITGDLTADEAKVLLYDLFGTLSDKNSKSSLEKIDFFAEGVEYNTKHKTAQVVTKFVSKGAFRSSSDFYPLYLANYILGESGLSSRLSKVIREKEGLTYGVYTYLTNSDAVALIEGGFSATPENFEKAQQLLKEEWLKLGKKGVTAEELNEAKKSLLNSFYLRFATIDGISDMLVAMQKYNLGLDFLTKRNDYIRQVSLKDVNAVSKKYFSTIPDFVNVGVNN